MAEGKIILKLTCKKQVSEISKKVVRLLTMDEQFTFKITKYDDKTLPKIIYSRQVKYK